MKETAVIGVSPPGGFSSHGDQLVAWRRSAPGWSGIPSDVGVPR
jgi:hypothetical protein